MMIGDLIGSWAAAMRRRNRITHSVHCEHAVEAMADHGTARSESTESTVAAIARCSGVVSSPGRTLAGLVTPRPASLSCSAGMLRHSSKHHRPFPRRSATGALIAGAHSGYQPGGFAARLATPTDLRSNA